MKLVFAAFIALSTIPSFASTNEEAMTKVLEALKLPTDISKNAEYEFTGFSSSYLSPEEGTCKIGIKVIADSSNPRMVISANGYPVTIFKKSLSRYEQADSCSKAYYDGGIARNTTCTKIKDDYYSEYNSRYLTVNTYTKKDSITLAPTKDVSIDIIESRKNATHFLGVVIHRTQISTGWSDAYENCYLPL